MSTQQGRRLMEQVRAVVTLCSNMDLTRSQKTRLLRYRVEVLVGISFAADSCAGVQFRIRKGVNASSCVMSTP